MASRTKMKEEARARRIAEERAAAERTRKRRRMQMLGGILIVAVAVIAVAIAVSSGGGGSKGIAKTNKDQAKTIAAVSTLLSGIPQSGATLGNPKAPVKITYYGDLECPVCQAFTLQGGFPQLVQHEVRSGKAQVTFSPFQTATRDPQTFQTQQIAALAAGMQKKFWDFTELFYRQQGAEGTNYVTEDYLDTLAHQVPGLNYNQWLQDRKNPALLAEEQGQTATAAGLGVNSTPTLIFKGPKGTANPPAGVLDYSQIQQAINQVS
jgi:protein-disulfide isomerase